MRRIRIVALIEYENGRIEYRTFASEKLTPAQLKTWIRQRWPKPDGVKRIVCGNYTVENFYGAH